MYRGQILPRTLPRVQTNSCLPALQISMNFQFYKMQTKASLILSSDYFHSVKIHRKMPVKYIQYFQVGVGLDGSEPQRSYQVHPSSGILLVRYYNRIANPFQFYQRWKLNLNKYSDSNKNRASNDLNISSMYEIGEKISYVFIRKLFSPNKATLCLRKQQLVWGDSSTVTHVKCAWEKNE